MGSCMGRCLPKSTSGSNCYRNHNIFRDRENEFHFLMDEEEPAQAKTTRNNFMSRLLFKRKNRSRSAKKPVLELVEDIWHAAPNSSYGRLKKPSNKRLPNSSVQGYSDIPLQCLDVRALLARNTGATTSSTPVSSLDLEWEHETLPASANDPSISSWAMVPEENLLDLSASESVTQKAESIASDWSRVSSADSLEWDPVQSPLHCTPSGSELDTDTQQLLCEIERLTDQALRETGRTLDS